MDQDAQCVCAQELGRLRLWVVARGLLLLARGAEQRAAFTSEDLQGMLELSCKHAAMRLLVMLDGQRKLQALLCKCQASLLTVLLAAIQTM